MLGCTIVAILGSDMFVCGGGFVGMISLSDKSEDSVLCVTELSGDDGDEALADAWLGVSSGNEIVEALGEGGFEMFSETLGEREFET